jgi:hypothetical protein
MGPARSPAWLAWCAPALFLGAVLLGAWIVFARPFSLFGGVLLALSCVPIGWVLVSALWPARAERRCPVCGGDTLVRLDARATHGLGCSTCSYRDESASAWLLAEEDGPLEEIVLAQRGRSSGRLVEPRPRD